jgi:vacuolar-type H+-ATPase subunit H
MPEGEGGLRLDAAGVDAAIAQLLQAERDARNDVQRCAEQADRLLEQARERARQIARRAAHRSVRVQRWYAAMLQRQLDAIERQQVGIAQAPIAATETAPCQAVATLAAQLTGAAR